MRIQEKSRKWRENSVSNLIDSWVPGFDEIKPIAKIFQMIRNEEAPTPLTDARYEMELVKSINF